MIGRWYWALLLVASCGRETNGEHVPAPSPSTHTNPSTSSTSAAQPLVVEGAGGLLWDSAAPLVRHTPRTHVRAAEYGVDGDPRAELLVFYHGNRPTGSIDSNVQGWLAQVDQTDGTDSALKAKRGDFDVGGLSVHTVEVSGIYTGPAATPGVQGATPPIESTLLGAIVQGPKGPVFFKLTGPRATVERARDAFQQLLRSVRPK